MKSLGRDKLGLVTPGKRGMWLLWEISAWAWGQDCRVSQCLPGGCTLERPALQVAMQQSATDPMTGAIDMVCVASTTLAGCDALYLHAPVCPWTGLKWVLGMVDFLCQQLKASFLYRISFRRV